MSGKKKKKLRNRMIRQVLADKITVEDARRKLGVDTVGKSAAPSLAKADRAGIQAQMITEAAAALKSAGSAIQAARPFTYDDLAAAATAPMPRPVIRQVPQAEGQMGPEAALKALRGMTEKRAEPGPPRRWTAGQRALQAEIEANSDPVMREAYRTHLYKERGDV